ncbi:helicase [Corynebacterium phocae]|uniref:Helicase n=1 Tax=Corynebacterium phocae TaxID=161895 RepID=A0A1L7D5U4_9CORY|nr:DEAD/DEAH box helicase [Corynebacterium phocae]APT93363.1 helicase [Corynebacterium phocae]KAA8721703.1 DEAD/DEAH box helicase [Corynebacterium phocae]
MIPDRVSPTRQPATSAEDAAQLAPGIIVEVRDEEWLVTSVIRSVDGWKIKARGLTEYVRDSVATFYSAIDNIQVFDPTQVEVVPDSSPQYRHSRLWMETTLRNTPVPLYQEDLSVAPKMLADPLPYQLSAVRKALSEQNIRPRVLLADAVGLGKTLEIGMILAELIRRGRGDRILVVTPKSVLEQFQQEMWTRFSIPLVRLDSQGIQKVRQKLPASRNPFTFFPRVIVSIDTLKSPKYRAQLEKVNWDAVVIDEIHNATNAGTQNNQLARTLAPTTESLILASATPHNGDPESFKEILRLLDPTSVLPDGSIDVTAAKRLIIRRHRNSDEVAQVVGQRWAKREEPKNIIIDPSEQELDIAKELDETWISPEDSAPSKDHLFPWTLVKAFLSSPAALQETVASRLERAKDPQERAALEKLQGLANELTPETSEKYNALVNYLQEIGIKRNSPTRVVVFSERVATLKWLQENLTKHLKLKKGAVAIMHGDLSDVEQMELIDSFKREDSPIRVLVTGDVASEGVNLHTQCHHLVHYDIPWSLIRIQQRNGRIDRYGQEHSPEIVSLLLDTGEQAEGLGELRVLAKLIEREHTAHEILGDAASLMGKHSIGGEEEEIRRVLQGTRDFDAAVRTPEAVQAGAHALIKEQEQAENNNADTTLADIDDLLAMLNPKSDPDAGSSTTATHSEIGSLYTSEAGYLLDALAEAFADPRASKRGGGIELVEHRNDIVEFAPPADLQRRLDFLPQDYVEYRKVYDKLSLATSAERGNQLLQAARQGDSEKSWPTAVYLGPLSPATSWAADRALSSMSRREIPAITGNVDSPTVFLMGTLTNSRGQIVSCNFVTASRNEWGIISPDILLDPVAWLKSAGLSMDAINPGGTKVPEGVQALIAESVDAAQGQVALTKQSATAAAEARISQWQERAARWEEKREGAAHNSRAVKQGAPMIEAERKLIPDLEPDRTLVRPLLLIVPAN